MFVIIYAREIVIGHISYSLYRTGTSLQLRLMRGVFSNANDFLPHEPPFQASSWPTCSVNDLLFNGMVFFYGLIFISDFVKKYL